MNNYLKITDDRFAAERTDLYDLHLEIQFSHFRFMVKSGEQPLWLEDHFLGYSNNITTCLAKCAALLEQHPFLRTALWKRVKLASALQIHTLVPTPVFDAAKAATYLELTYPAALPADFEISFEPVLNQQVITGCLQEINRFFREYYPDLTPLSIVAEGAKYLHPLSPDLTFGLISDSFIDLIYRKGKNQDLTTEKILTRNLNDIIAPTSTLVLFGEITPFSTRFKLLEEKFKTVIPGTPAAAEEWTGNFRNIPAHRYFTLLHG